MDMVLKKYYNGIKGFNELQ